jgi:hypothetical protein
MVRATRPGGYSDVIVKEFSFDVLGDGDRKKLLAVCWEMLETSGDGRRCVCAHSTLPASHMLASLGAHVESWKELSVLMRLSRWTKGQSHDVARVIFRALA